MTQIGLWHYHGQKRPPFAQKPGPGQESVWDYPRPPSIEPEPRHVVVCLGAERVAASRRALRILETASPPTLYIPAGDVRVQCMDVVDGHSMCEWKGAARYWAWRDDPARDIVAWDYPEPLRPFRRIAGHLCFYPARARCFLDDERVRPQPGRFYGGWVTDDVVGPFKGTAGTEHW